MLSFRILLFALSTTVMGLRQLEDDQALQQEVEFDRLLTPSVRPESLISDDEKVPPPVPSALLEQQGCSKQYNTVPGKVLGKGNWGTVYEVEEQGSQEHFALKMVSASSEQGKIVLQHEANVMFAAGTCSHVVPLIMPAPCVDGKQRYYSFVTTLLPYDLHKWRNQQTSTAKLAHCYPVVAKAVYEGLKCLHASGSIHGDLKADNILFKDLDADGCPSGIVLGDLGMAQKIGSSMSKYPASDYAGSSHLVASLFDGQSDPLKINTMVRVRGFYVNGAMVEPKIDYCSWAVAVTYYFSLEEDKDLTKMLGKGSCGPMGPGRRKLYP